METTQEGFYWNDEDKKDQEFRRSINEGRVYTESASCDFCGAQLQGRAFQCEMCDALACTLCVCDDGCCPSCTRA